MGKSAILSVKIVGDTKSADRAFQKTEGRLDKLSSSTSSMAAPAAGIVAGLTAAATKTQQLAATAQQNMGAVNTVFKGSAARVQEWADAASSSVGLSTSAYNELAAGIGGSLSSAIKDQDKLASSTNELITASSDLSSVFGGTTAEAAGAMGAALRGEYDSLERFGVFLNANAVQAELARRGQDKLTGAALDAAKKQATQNLILEQASKYQGNFTREANTSAGAQQRANAAFADAGAKLGEALIPAMTVAATKAAVVARWAARHPKLVQRVVVVLGVLAGAILLVQGATAAWTAITGVWAGITATATATQTAWNAAMAANPIGIIILAVIALIAVFVLLYKRNERFRNFVNRMVREIAEWFGGLGRKISGVWGGLTGGIKTAYSAVKRWTGKILELARKLRDGIGDAFSKVGNIPGLSSVLGSGAQRPPTIPPADGRPFFLEAESWSSWPATLGRSSRATAGTVVQINVEGALDPVSVAQQIRGILAADVARTGVALR